MINYAPAFGTVQSLLAIVSAPLAAGLAKGTTLVCLAAVLTIGWRRASAASRHFVWLLAVCGVLVLPLATVALPRVRVPIPQWLLDAVPASASRDAVAATLPALTFDAAINRALPAQRVTTPTTRRESLNASIRQERDGESTPSTVLAVSSRGTPTRDVKALAPRLDLTTVVGVVWLAGSLLMLASLGAGQARLYWVARRARPITRGPWADAFAVVAGEVPLRRRVTLLATGDAEMPMTWGIAHPVLLLPADAHRWPAQQRVAVIRHELAHVRRFDCLTQIAAQLACACYWVNPLVWLAARQMRVERERACDDEVLRAGAKPSEYAASLLAMANQLRPAPVTAFAALAMARRSQLGDRVRAMLDDQRQRDRVTARQARRVIAASALTIAGVASVAPAPRLDARTAPMAPAGFLDQPRASKAPVARVTPAPALREPDPGFVPTRLLTPPPGQQQACARDKRGGSHTNWTESSSDGRQRSWKVRWTQGDCSFSIDAVGDIKFTPNLTDVQSITDGGFFELERRIGNESRRIVIKPNAGGLERSYYVNRDRADYDAAARAWMAECLLQLERHTAFAAQTRVPALLARGGVPSVLQEIDSLEGDYARRRYYTELLAARSVTRDEVRQVVERAGRQIDSDYELAELLIQVAKLDAFGDDSHAAFVAATQTLQSDYERRRALAALLAKPGLSKQTVQALLTSAAEMKSDYELAELLIAVAGKYGVDERTRPIYLDAASKIKSDYEHRRVLSAVMRNASRDGGRTLQVVPKDSMDRVLESAGYSKDAKLRPGYALQSGKGEPLYIIDGVVIGSGSRTDSSSGKGADVLSSATTKALLKDASRIKSDYDLAELLIELSTHGRLDASNVDDYLAAASGIKGDYDHHRALAVLVRRDLYSKPLVKALLESARSLKSDYERASLLVSIAETFPLDADLSEAYLKTAKTLGSEYEYSRAVAAMRNPRTF